MDATEKKLLIKAIYDIVSIIPRGKATSYGAIARAVGYPNLSRMVGRIMGSGEVDFDTVPAHRVVNSSGILSGRHAFGSPGRMAELLADEGVAVRNNRIVGWKNVFWDPLTEIQADNMPHHPRR